MTHLRTRAVHAGQHPDPTTGAIATPISQTTAFGYGTLERGAAIFAGEAPGYRYSRFANPTVAALEAKMADLEGAAAAVAFASGTAASSSVLLGLLSPGDELVFLGPLYGGTEGLLRNLGERWGITVVECAALVILLAIQQPGGLVHDMLSAPALVRLGRLSYGIYLWHWPVFMVTRPGIDLAWTGWEVQFLRITLVLVLAEIPYRLVERPIRRGALVSGRAAMRTAGTSGR